MTTLFVSDLHLDAGTPAAVEAFTALLAGEARSAAALYVLGDLFESWIGDDDTDPVRSRVCTALTDLTAAGTPVFVLHGNRDFLLGAGFEARTGARLLPDPAVATLDGERVLLTHGDLLCTDDAAYQALRTQTRDPRFQRRLLSLTLAQRELLAGAARAGSRAHTATARPAIMDVNATAVERLMRAAGVVTLVHGHTHRPAIHELLIDGRRARRIVLDAWYERASLLRWSHGIAELRDWPFSAPAPPNGSGTRGQAP